MSIFDELSRKVNDGIRRVQDEAERMQRLNGLQRDLSDMRRQLDGKRIEFGDRAIELFRAGRIQSPTLAEMLRTIDALQAAVTLKEEELRTAQGGVVSVAPPPPEPAAPPVPPAPAAPPVPAAPAVSAAPPVGADGARRYCHRCGTALGTASRFCPTCGTAAAP